MRIIVDFVVGLMSLTNARGETRRYVRGYTVARPFQPHVAPVSRTQARVLPRGDGQPNLAGDEFPPTVVVTQFGQSAVGSEAWAYTPDERAYWIREQIGAAESEACGPDPAAIADALRSAKPQFAWNLAEVAAEVGRCAKEAVHGS
jgi:small-conductance mechanosensitive channel